MRTNRQPASVFPWIRALASVCVPLFTSPVQAATPYPTAFDRILMQALAESRQWHLQRIDRERRP